MDSPADGANRGLLSSGGIERSIGTLIVGIGVILFFFLAIVGMNRVEKASTNATRVSAPSSNSEASEIGGVSPDKPRP